MTSNEAATLRYGLKTARDLYEKLKREAARLDNEVTSDTFFNFIVTAYHLREWLQNDPSAQEAASRLQREPPSPLFGICRDLCDASKHFELTRRPAEVADSAKSLHGYGWGRFGRGKFGTGEETIIITCKDGSELNALHLAAQVLDLYARIFSDETPTSRAAG